ncbi:hypothetical protein LCGC14_0377920 [marine sediment metagenome]|uniref:VRR-NUC domain-containing protein n=1 Tax=marine sediment metagenome TaxID=412755 RepID=A0A0F9T908_9ZZZZ
MGRMVKENKFQTKLKKILESQCAFIINQHGHMMQRSGIPDLQIIHRRWHGFLELKVGKNKPSDIQKSVAAAIELRGVPVYVLRCVERPIDSGLCGYNLTLEDFEGKVIRRCFRLDSLLNILAGLSPQLVGGFDNVD